MCIRDSFKPSQISSIILKKRHLKLNLPGGNQETKIIRGLSKLKTLNGVMLFRDAIQLDQEKHPKKQAFSKKEIKNKFRRKDQSELDEQDLMEMMKLYNKFTLVLKDEAERKEVAEELDEHMKEVLTDLKLNTKNIRHSSLKELHHLKAKYTLCAVSYTHLTLPTICSV